MDKISKEKRSEVMRAVRGKDTKIEVSFRKSLWKLGVRYRKNSNKFYGKPDMVNERRKIVIFVDSCFWHGCKSHCRMPKSNLDFWQSKIEKNKERDTVVKKFYKNKGWVCVRVWEHDLIKKDDFEKTAQRIFRIFSKGQ